MGHNLTSTESKQQPLLAVADGTNLNKSSSDVSSFTSILIGTPFEQDAREGRVSSEVIALLESDLVTDYAMLKYRYPDLFDDFKKSRLQLSRVEQLVLFGVLLCEHGTAAKKILQDIEVLETGSRLGREVAQKKMHEFERYWSTLSEDEIPCALVAIVKDNPIMAEAAIAGCRGLEKLFSLSKELGTWRNLLPKEIACQTDEDESSLLDASIEEARQGSPAAPKRALDNVNNGEDDDSSLPNKMKPDHAAVISARVDMNEAGNAVELFMGVRHHETAEVWSKLSAKAKRMVWLNCPIDDRVKLVRRLPPDIVAEMLQIVPVRPEEFPRTGVDNYCQCEPEIAAAPSGGKRAAPPTHAAPSQPRVQRNQPKKPAPPKVVGFNVPNGSGPILWSKIAAKLPDCNIKNVHQVDNGFLVTAKTVEEAEQIRRLTAEDPDLDGITLLPPSQRKYRVVLQNYDASVVSEDMVKDHLQDKAIRVSTMASKFTGRAGQLLVTLSDYDFACSLVRDGSKLAPFVLKFRWFAEHRTVKQCFNCQGFGHLATNCTSAARCLRCGENHQLRLCQVDRQNAHCCNCGGNHAANAATCPVRPAPAKKKSTT